VLFPQPPFAFITIMCRMTLSKGNVVRLVIAR
jgi:hypothetical protein